jgi:AcrR family transcriptional regulator
MKRRLTARGQERRHQLMDEAARRFATSGYDPTSVAEIVDSLGVGKGVFYWYFASKEELLCEILREAQHDLRRCQHAAIRGEPDPVRRITLGIRASMAWLSGHRDVFTLFEFAALDERFRPMLRRGQDVAVGDVVRHLEGAVVEGSIADADPLAVAHAILGVTNQLARTFVLHRGDDWEQVADAAVAFCLGGLFGHPNGNRPSGTPLLTGASGAGQ